MELVTGQYLAAGLALVGAGLSGVGIGLVYAATAPEQSKRLGLALTGGFGLACLLTALVLMFR